MKPILILHGIETDGSNLTALAESLTLLGADVQVLHLEKTKWYQWNSDSIMHTNVSIVRRHYKEGCHLIGHSNGARLGRNCMYSDLFFDQVFFLNAALDAALPFPETQYGRIYNFHNPRDRALLFGSMIPWSKWGQMGRVGYKGKSERIINIPDKTFRPFTLNHHNLIEKHYVKTTAQLILDKIKYNTKNKLMKQISL